MTLVTIGVIKYYLKNNDFYIIGDNSTSSSYAGEITIPEKVNNAFIFKQLMQIITL